MKIELRIGWIMTKTGSRIFPTMLRDGVCSLSTLSPSSLPPTPPFLMEIITTTSGCRAIEVRNHTQESAAKINLGGRKVQEVEDIPQNIENKWDNAVDDVEDVPDDVAGFFGREAGRVERFDDGIQDSFDQGRDEERYDDNNDDY